MKAAVCVLLAGLLALAAAQIDMNDAALFSSDAVMNNQELIQLEAGMGDAQEGEEEVPGFDMNQAQELLSLEEGPTIQPVVNNPAGRGAVLRQCMNHCGGLCQQLCSKFKHLKVCNGCMRGCYKRCEVKEDVVIEKTNHMALASPPFPHRPQAINA